jgi:hypothetical protein
MKLSISLLSLTTLFPLTSANPFPSHHALPPAFFLAGDSTTAIQLLSNTSNGGGWGTGFIQQLVHGAIGTNYGHNGATTASFVSGGDWAKVLKDVKSVRGKYRAFVTIQVRVYFLKSNAGRACLGTLMIKNKEFRSNKYQLVRSQ